MSTKAIVASLTPEAASGSRIRAFQTAWGLALPLLEHGVGWQSIWRWLGTACIAVGVLLSAITPREPRSQSSSSSWASALNPYLIVFRNPQSYLCGAVAGLLFVPTTIGDA